MHFHYPTLLKAVRVCPPRRSADLGHQPQCPNTQDTGPWAPKITSVLSQDLWHLAPRCPTLTPIDFIGCFCWLGSSSESSQWLTGPREIALQQTTRRRCKLIRSPISYPTSRVFIGLTARNPQRSFELVHWHDPSKEVATSDPRLVKYAFPSGHLHLSPSCMRL